MTSADSPLSIALDIASAFDADGISYAIGGALAYGIWGIPRATIDIDINVFTTEDDLARACESLGAVGIQVDARQVRHEAATQGMFVARCGRYRLDVFTASIPFCSEAERTRVRVAIGGRSAWFLSAAALAVFKMLFFRPKDIADLERLIAVQGNNLNTDYVRLRLVEMVGADDVRIARWEQLVATST